MVRKKREKGFSVGYFDEAYINRSDVAILRDKNGNIVSFMTMMPIYQQGCLSIDLMRYIEDPPSGIMDTMVIHLFKWAQERGYTFFDMRMTPLSNVGLEE
ncbi:MAG: phosphatidylglycerol lysyltransferase domain-containing protein [Bacillaceae bacterium]